MKMKLNGIKKKTSVKFNETDTTVKLTVGKETVELAYNQICDLKNMLNKTVDRIFDDAAAELGF